MDRGGKGRERPRLAPLSRRGLPLGAGIRDRHRASDSERDTQAGAHVLDLCYGEVPPHSCIVISEMATSGRALVGMVLDEF